MTRRSFHTLRLLPILALAPLLTAPRGCHFGSDEVPLGSNADDGEAGAGTGADGSGGSDTTGGTGSANGGSTTNGGSSGSSTGGTGATSKSDGPCLEELTEITTSDPTPFGFTATDVQTLLAGRHRTTLATRNTAATYATLEFVGPIRLYSVESRRNPDFLLDIVVECNEHVRAKTFARFVSDDGVFDETFPELELNVGAVMDSSSMPERTLHAGGGLTLDRHELRGSYHPPIPDSQCFLALQFDVTISRVTRAERHLAELDEFTGLLMEQILYAPCGSTASDLAVGISELGTWRCQGETCRLPPNDTVVVEASSCDRFGPQITGSGDEASFERSGDVLSREEGYGCGCATRAEHVMAYTPTSPVELRLCHDDGADGCERFCGVSLSYDLSRAFDAADTREFRFVD